MKSDEHHIVKQSFIQEAISIKDDLDFCYRRKSKMHTRILDHHGLHPFDETQWEPM